MIRLNIGIRSFLAVVVIISGVYTGSAQKLQAEVQTGSKMEIHGSSNVNHFTCIFPAEEIESLSFDFNKDAMLFRKAEPRLPVATFDCVGSGINRDFRELLQEKKHQEVKINLRRIRLTSAKEPLASIGLEIGSIKNNFHLPVSFQKKKGLLHHIRHLTSEYKRFQP